jgi:hypothetical protein
MKIHPFVLFLTSTALALFPQGTLAEEDELKGRWTVVSVPDGWKKVPGTSVVISDGKIQICVGKVPMSSLAYTLNRASGGVEAIRKVKGKTVVQRGVYRKTGDTLTLSVGAEGKPAPASPDATGAGVMHWVFRRAG